MRIITKAEYIWSDELARYVLTHEDSFEYTGAVALCKGASDQQNQLAQSQQAFYSTMTADYNQQFANQSAILSSINASLQPIIQAGPSQFGFSTAETNNLNSQAIEGTAQQYNHAQKALQENQAAAGGGNQFLPSGVTAQQKEQLASTGANQTSSELLGIQEAGYQQGRQNYQTALNSEEGVAGLQNPTGYAGAATGAGTAAANEANVISQENAAASPWSTIGGLLGGVAGSFLGPIGASVGSSIGRSLGGLGGGSTGLQTGAAEGTDGGGSIGGA